MNNKLNVLIIEDDVSINDIEKRVLEKNGFGVIQAYSGSEGLLNCQSRKEEIDIIIMDLFLPGIDGYELLPQIKDILDVPVIVVSAISDIVDKVKLLDAGANDYITKPFGVMELIARVKALLRRTEEERKASGKEKYIRLGDIFIDDYRRIVFVADEKCELTYKEYELLKLLSLNAGIVLTREIIMEKVWGVEFESESRTVDMHIKTLRQKLGEAGNIIKTVRNVGYVAEL